MSFSRTALRVCVAVLEWMGAARHRPLKVNAGALLVLSSTLKSDTSMSSRSNPLRRTS